MSQQIFIENVISEIINLFDTYGNECYIIDGLSCLSHMIQAASNAYLEESDSDIVIAALLHDIGDLIAIRNQYEITPGFGAINHELIASDFLYARGFSRKVCSLIENHVKAKRYLCFKYPEYYREMSQSAKQILAMQGGVMSRDEAYDFEYYDYLDEVIELREYDDSANIRNLRHLQASLPLPTSEILYDIEAPKISAFEDILREHLIEQITRNFELSELLINKINIQINQYNVTHKDNNNKKIAAFDLDNTLISGDIGEALFAALKLSNVKIEYQWNEYIADINAGNASSAYINMVKSMEGIEFEAIKDALNLVSNRRGRNLHFLEDENDICVPSPHPKPQMQKLTAFLLAHDFKVFVISASFDPAVKFAISRFFTIHPDNAFGIKLSVNNSKYSSELAEPIPVYEGKSELYFKEISDIKPLLTFGDSAGDISLFNMTDTNGFAFFIGNDKLLFSKIKEKISDNIEFIMLDSLIS